MDFLNHTYLRVLKPITTDGVNIDIDDQGQAKYKELELPLSAERQLQEVNSKLPKALKLRIERVTPNAIQVPVKKAEPTEEQKRIAALEAELEEMREFMRAQKAAAKPPVTEPENEPAEPEAKRGPGRPAKIQATENAPV